MRSELRLEMIAEFYLSNFRHYYSIAINYRKNELEQRMLMNLNKKSWVDGLTLRDYNNHCK